MASSNNKQHGQRLGGFFKKRGAAGVSTDHKGMAPELPEPLFPSPSFIRPKSSRMMARDEVAAIRVSPSRRALSLPDQQAPTRVSFAHSHQPSFASTTSIPSIQSSPVRAVPLMQRRDVNVPELKDFQFPGRTTIVQNGEITPISLRSSNISPTQVPLPKSGRRIDSIDERIIIVPPRVDTPPASDPEDTLLVDGRFVNKQLPPLPPSDMPTPSPSPDMAPVSDSMLSDPRVSEMLNSTLYSDIERTLDNAIPGSSLRKSKSHSNLVSTRSSSIYSAIVDTTVLREPTFNDFMNLSDDDIAEAHVDPQQPMGPPPALPPTPPPTATTLSACQSHGPSLLTLPPPFTSRPATAGAFEAARIAARYNFDLVYVVNLWPEGTGNPLLTPTRSEARTGLTGRFLAAYGLSTVKSPFRISTAVHSKILQGEGWIEYRNDEAQEDEFARGYACAFHAGQYGRRPSVDSTVSLSARKPQKHTIDRGIVFAAYRKPSEDGRPSVGCTKVELEAIRQDAEALAEMLIDIHAANRLRQPPSANFLHSDETGPMPIHRPGFI